MNDKIESSALAEAFAQALLAPMLTVANAIRSGGKDVADLGRRLDRLTVAVEGILDRLTPESERPRVYQVGSYVRSANNGGDLVWLYATHPGLEYKTCTIYVEKFPLLRPYLDPTVGKVFDGEVAPSRSAAAKKGYLNECAAPFEVVLTPTGKTTDAGLPIYEFEAARRVATDASSAATEAAGKTADATRINTPPQPAGPPDAATAPAVPNQPLPPSQQDAPPADWEELQSASANRPPFQPPQPQPGPKVSNGAHKGAPAPSILSGAPGRAVEGRRQAAIGGGPVYAAFTKWAGDFAGRYPHYRIANSDRPDFYHIQCSMYEIGENADRNSQFSHIKDLDLLSEAIAALEAHAAQKHIVQQDGGAK